MKIAFCGTHGTGKTTLVLQMAAAAKSLYPHMRVGIVTEQARNCPLPINQEAPVETQLWLYHSQFTAEIEEESRTEILVCDRTVLDAVAYAAYHGMNRLVSNCQSQVENWWSSYDAVVFCRPDKTLPVDDGVRSNDKYFQLAVHRQFEFLFARWSLPHVIFSKDTQQNLIDLIETSINRGLSRPRLISSKA